MKGATRERTGTHPGNDQEEGEESGELGPVYPIADFPSVMLFSRHRGNGEVRPRPRSFPNAGPRSEVSGNLESRGGVPANLRRASKLWGQDGEDQEQEEEECEHPSSSPLRSSSAEARVTSSSGEGPGDSPEERRGNAESGAEDDDLKEKGSQDGSEGLVTVTAQVVTMVITSTSPRPRSARHSPGSRRSTTPS